MEKKTKLFIILSVGLAFLCFTEFSFAQTPAKPPLPSVLVTYQGDNPETIKRRALWVEEAKKEGILVWWGTSSPPEAAKIIAEFNKVYPFIKVTFWRATGEEIASKLEAEHRAGRPTSDISLGGEPENYPRWRKMGMLGKFSDIMPAIKTMDRRNYSRYGDWAVSGNNAMTPQYNTKLVSAAEAPKNWEDLYDPKWKGHIAMTTDMKVWIALAMEEGGWGVEKTGDFLRKIKQQQPLWTPGHTAGHNLLIAGEFKVLCEDQWYHIRRSKEKGAPVEWVKVNPVPITGSSFTLVNNAPHPHAARLFLEWQFSLPGLNVFDAVTGKGAAFPGSGTRQAKALEGLNLIYRTEDGVIKAGELGLEKKFAEILGVTPGGD